MNQFTTFFLGYVSPTVAPKDFDQFAQVPATVEIPLTNGTLDEIFALGAKTTTLGKYVSLIQSQLQRLQLKRLLTAGMVFPIATK